MADADIKIVAIAVILAVTYGTFLFLNANTDMDSMESEQLNATQYNTPDSGSFFDSLEKIGQLQDDHPEIFFVNTILFGTIALLILFIGLRFLRGTG